MLSLPACPALAAQNEQDIVGYVYGCSAKLATPAGELSGELTVGEDGTPENFFAHLYGVKAAGDSVSWPDSKTLRRLGRSEVVRWSMSWRGQLGEALKTFGEGNIGIEVSTPRKLALDNMLVIGRDNFPSAPMVASGRRWPGQKNGAQFTFRISELLGYAGNVQRLQYWLYSSPLPHDWVMNIRGRRASGAFDLQVPRSVADAYERLRRELLARAADHRNSCERKPVYHQPEGDI